MADRGTVSKVQDRNAWQCRSRTLGLVGKSDWGLRKTIKKTTDRIMIKEVHGGGKQEEKKKGGGGEVSIPNSSPGSKIALPVGKISTGARN